MSKIKKDRFIPTDMTNACIEKETIKLKNQVVRIEKNVGFKISSIKKLEEANSAMVEVKEIKKIVAHKKAGIIKPLTLAMKNSRALFKPVEDKLKNVEEALKKGILDYKKKVDIEIKVRQDKIVEMVEKGETTFEKGSEKMEKTITKTQKFKIRKTRDIEIINEGKIPQEYWVLDNVKLRKDVLTGVNVPGVKVIIKEISI